MVRLLLWPGSVAAASLSPANRGLSVQTLRPVFHTQLREKAGTQLFSKQSHTWLSCAAQYGADRSTSEWASAQISLFSTIVNPQKAMASSLAIGQILYFDDAAGVELLTSRPRRRTAVGISCSWAATHVTRCFQRHTIGGFDAAPCPSIRYSKLSDWIQSAPDGTKTPPHLRS